MNQLYSFQLIRAAACLLVCFSHVFITQKQNVSLYQNFIGIGQIGVGMFFFISGYLIMASLFRYNVRAFAIHRILRIYPVLVFISFIMVAIGFIYGDSPWSYLGKSSKIAQFFLMSDIFNKGRFLAVQWTLFIEIKFYILIAIAFYSMRNFDTKKFLAVFYFLILAAYIFFSELHIEKHPIAANTGGGIMFISLGVLFYLKEKNFLNFKDWLWLNIAIILAAVGLFVDVPTHNLRLMESTNFIVGYLICAWLLSRNFSYNSVINFFAEISYPLYLIHGFISLDYFEFEEKVFVFSVMILFSWLVHIFVEKKGIEISKKLTLKI